MERDIFGAFTLSELQTFRNIILVGYKARRSMDSILRYIDARVAAYGLEVFNSCPDCGQPLRIGAVNTHPSNRVGGDARTQWFCGCGYEEFSLRSPSEEISRVRREQNGTR